MADTERVVTGCKVGVGRQRPVGGKRWPGPTRLLALALLAGLIFPAPARAQGAAADAQKLMEKARSGHPLTPAEQARLRADLMQQSQQRLDQTQSSMPPKIQALMQKARLGRQLTPEDKAALRQWAIDRAMHGRGGVPGAGARPPGPGSAHAGAGPSGAGGPHRPTVMDFMSRLDHATPHAVPGVHVRHRKPLTRAGYLALLRWLRKQARIDLGSAPAKKIDHLGRKGARALNRLGVALQIVPGGQVASTYALAAAALKRPADALIAANLGVALYNDQDLPRAYDVLGYALALHPKNPVALSSRGFVAMYLGDLTAAASFFHQAVQLAPKLADPEVGLALVARARGDQRQMIAAAGKAIVKGLGSMVTQAMEASVHARESVPQRAQDTPIAEMGPPSVGGIVIDLHAGSSLRYPMWGMPADAHRAVGHLADITTFILHEKKRLLGLTKARLAVDRQYSAAQAAKRQALGGRKLIRLSPRILAVLTDLSDVYDARSVLALEAWKRRNHRFEKEADAALVSLRQAYLSASAGCGEDRKCQDWVDYEYCVKFNNQGKELHSAWSAAWASTQNDQRQLMTTYFKEGDPYVDGIADPTLQRVYQLDRVVRFHTFLLATRLEVQRWMPHLSPFVGRECIPPPKEPASNPWQDDAKTKDPKPGHCVPPPGELGVGVLGLAWDCNSLTVKGGEGLIVGVKIAFSGANGKGTPSGQTETTLMIGVGDQALIGGVNVHDDAMLTGTFTGNGMVDASLKVEAGMDAGMMGAKLSAGAEIGVSYRGGLKAAGSAGIGYGGVGLKANL